MKFFEQEAITNIQVNIIDAFQLEIHNLRSENTRITIEKNNLKIKLKEQESIAACKDIQIERLTRDLETLRETNNNKSNYFKELKNLIQENEQLKEIENNKLNHDLVRQISQRNSEISNLKNQKQRDEEAFKVQVQTLKNEVMDLQQLAVAISE